MDDLFSGLGGFMKGLSGFMPQNDPEVRLMTAQSELGDLQRQESELYVQIGKQALKQESGRFPELESRLKLVQANMLEAADKLKRAQAEKDAKEAAQQAEEQEHTCSSCGTLNPDGVKFCQECGAKLGIPKCAKCGAPQSPNARFCGECGAKVG